MRSTYLCFYVMCSTYCVSMFLCLLYAPSHQKKFQVGVNKYYSDSDSDEPQLQLESLVIILCVLMLFYLKVPCKDP